MTPLGPLSRLVAGLALLVVVTGCRPVRAPVGRVDAPESIRRAPAGRLVAIGDLHGDLEATRAALRLAGAIDEADRWIGGELVVVQTGDVLDRGDREREILALFARLRRDAAAAGGAFWPLLGNHELLNAQGDFAYVSAAGLDAFADLAATTDPSSAPPGVGPAALGRWAAFRPGGPLARQLAEQPVLLVVGDTALVHGGILPEHVAYGLDRLAAETAAWLRGETDRAPALVLEREGPLWTRFYAKEAEPRLCATLAEVLADIPAARLVIGHTIQEQGITQACDGRLWRIDVGMSQVFGGPVQVLELDPAPRVLR